MGSGSTNERMQAVCHKDGIDEKPAVMSSASTPTTPTPTPPSTVAVADPSSSSTATTEKKKRKKKKKASGYKNLMNGIMNSPASAEGRRSETNEEKIRRVTGGGAFSKVDKI